MTSVKLTVQNLMDRQGYQGLFRVGPDNSVKQAAYMMEHYAISAIAVVEEHDTILRLVGIVSEKDVSHLVARGDDANGMPVSDIMTSDVHTVTASTSLWEAARFMLDHNIRHLPVLDEDGQPIRTISMRDVLDLLVRTLEIENEQLRATLEWMGMPPT